MFVVELCAVVVVVVDVEACGVVVVEVCAVVVVIGSHGPPINVIAYICIGPDTEQPVDVKLIVISSVNIFVNPLFDKVVPISKTICVTVGPFVVTSGLTL